MQPIVREQIDSVSPIISHEGYEEPFFEEREGIRPTVVIEDQPRLSLYKALLTIPTDNGEVKFLFSPELNSLNVEINGKSYVLSSRWSTYLLDSRSGQRYIKFPVTIEDGANKTHLGSFVMVEEHFSTNAKRIYFVPAKGDVSSEREHAKQIAEQLFYVRYLRLPQVES